MRLWRYTNLYFQVYYHCIIFIISVNVVTTIGIKRLVIFFLIFAFFPFNVKHRSANGCQVTLCTQLRQVAKWDAGWLTPNCSRKIGWQFQYAVYSITSVVTKTANNFAILIDLSSEPDSNSEFVCRNGMLDRSDEPKSRKQIRFN